MNKSEIITNISRTENNKLNSNNYSILCLVSNITEDLIIKLRKKRQSP